METKLNSYDLMKIILRNRLIKVLVALEKFVNSWNQAVAEAIENGIYLLFIKIKIFKEYIILNSIFIFLDENTHKLSVENYIGKVIIRKRILKINFFYCFNIKKFTAKN